MTLAGFAGLVHAELALELGNTGPADGVNGCVEVRATATDATAPVYAWSMAEGPGDVFFDDATAAVTEAFFTAPGEYTLACTVTDGDARADAEMTVNVLSIGTKPVADLFHYSLPSTSTSKAQYGTGSIGKSAYLYFPGYFDGAVTYDDVYNKAGRFDGTVALSGQSKTFSFKAQGKTLSAVGVPAALTFATWLNGDGLTDEWSTYSLIGLPTTGFYVKLWKGDDATYPIDPDGKCYVELSRVDDGLGTWVWRTPTAICPANAWTHLAVSFDCDDLSKAPTLYLNGVLQALPVVSSTSTTASRSGWGGCEIYFCNRTSSGAEGFPGRMSDVRLYGRQLGMNDVKALLVADGAKQLAPKAVLDPDAELCYLPSRRVTLPVTVVTYFPDDTYTAAWTVLGENAEKVTVDGADQLDAHFTFAEEGMYTLKLTLRNGDARSETVYSVEASRSAPLDMTLELSHTGNAAGIEGCVEVRAKAKGVTEPVYEWFVVSGPDHVFFENAAAAATEAYFPVVGDYVIGCKLSDGEYSVMAELPVAVTALGDKPLGHLAYYKMTNRSKAQYGTGPAASHYILFTDYFKSEVTFDDAFKPGYFPGTYALYTPTTSYYWQIQGFTFSSLGDDPPALSFAAWINGETRATEDPETEQLLSLDTRGVCFFLWKGDGTTYPLAADGKRYLRLKWTDASFGGWTWQTKEPVCPVTGWQHVGFAVSRGVSSVTPAIYLNGVAQELVRIAAGGSETHRTIGGCNVYFASGYNSSTCFLGLMTDLRLYGRELGPCDMKTFAHADDAKTFAPVVVGQDETLDVLPNAKTRFAARVSTYPAGADVSAEWTVVGGDASKVVISDPTVLQPLVSFTALGDYALKLTVSNGSESSEKTYPVTVSYAPLVRAGADQTVTHPSTWLEGVLDWNKVGDGGDFAVTSQWAQVSGPATAEILHADRALSEVTLPELGEYVFRLSAVNSYGTFADDVVVTRLAEAPGNQAPVLAVGSYASNDVTAARGYVRGTVGLKATVADPDAYPSATPRLRWFRQSGPGGAFFDDATAAETAARFSAVGDYVIGCEASDGDLAVTNFLSLTVEVIGDKPDPDGFFYRFTSTGQSIYDERHRTRVWGSGVYVWEDGRFPGTYGFRCPGNATTFSLINVNFPAPQGSAFACWIETHDMTNDTSRFINSLNSFWFGVTKSNGAAAPESADGNYYLQCGFGNGQSENGWTSKKAVVPHDGWNHVAVSWDWTNGYSAIPVVWLNGERVELNDTGLSGAIAWGTNYMYLGNRYSSEAAGSKQFPGIMSDVRFFVHGIGDKDVEKLLNEKNLLNHAPECYRTGELPSVWTTRTWYDLPYEAFDDGLPEGDVMTVQWSVTKGNAANVVFSDATSAASRVKFRAGGEYELTLTVTDGQYERTETVKAGMPVKGLCIIVR